jgi:hypothetical protein
MRRAVQMNQAGQEVRNGKAATKSRLRCFGEEQVFRSSASCDLIVENVAHLIESFLSQVVIPVAHIDTAVP